MLKISILKILKSLIKKGIWLLFLFLTHSFSQSNTFELIINTDLPQREKEVKLDSIINLLIINSNDSLHNFHESYASWLYKNQKYKIAIFHTKKALQFEKKLKLKNEFRQRNLYKLGKYFKRSDSIFKAIKCFNDALKVNNDNKIAVDTYFQLGFSYIRINDNIKALDNFKITKSLLTSKFKNNKKKLIRTCINISYLYSNIGGIYNYKKGILVCEFADSIIANSTISLRDKYLIKLNLASFYNKFDFLNIDKSSKYYNQALILAKKQKDTFKITQTLLSLGNLYSTTNYNESLTYLDKAATFCEKGDSINLMRLYLFYSQTYARKKMYKKSIENNYKNIKYLTDYELNNFNKIIDIVINDYRFKLYLLESLTILGETYIKLFEETNDSSLLIKSINHFKIADDLLNKVRLNNYEFKSKLFWRKLGSDIYGKAIRACYLNNNLKDALYFIEKNKALLLIEGIAIQNYRLSLNISKKTLQKEVNFKKEIFSIAKIKNDSILKIKNDLERGLYVFQDSIYKGKKKHNKSLKILAIKEIQKSLTKNEVFIEYHISKDDGYGIYTNNENGYVIFLTKNKSYFFEINKMTDFRKTLKAFIKNLKVPLETKEGVEEFNKNSCAIYNKLFPTNKIKELINNKKLTIVPDGILSFLPFETLITKQNTSEYLIFTSEISYAFSGSFQHENKKMQRKPKKEFLGIAPITFNYDSLTNLPKTKQEILTIKKLFSSNHYFTETATKQNFEQTSNDYNIIHLATHADASDEASPWIAFKNEKLLLDDLYTTKTQADLVVLSACNTSLGKIETGEGVMSLVRGFFYSGTNSVVSSLWNVNDKVSSNIMIDFYKNLKKGNTKSKALHNAKIKYLKNHTLTEASPYYWSSFILIGDAGELASIDSNLNYFYYFVGVLILFFLVFIVRKVTIMK